MKLFQKIFWPTHGQIDLKQTTIEIRDGTTPTPFSLEVRIGEGNLTYTENKERDYTLDRGRLDTVRDADEAPVDVTMDATWEWLRSKPGDTIPTIEEALKNTGLAAAWVSSSDDPCEPYAVDLVITYKPDCEAVETHFEVITIADFRYETIEHDIDAGTLSITGRANVTEAAPVRVPFSS